MEKETKIVFFGTPILAVWALEEMQAAGIVPSIVVTAPDAPSGRGRVITPPPVKVWAEANNIPILQPTKLDEDFLRQLTKISSYKTPSPVASLPAQAGSSSRNLVEQKFLFLVFAYGKILPKEVLDTPEHGTLNIHPSMLPKLRGPSPIRTAILKDMKDEIGVSIILLDDKMDHGKVVAQEKVEMKEWPIAGSKLDNLLSHEGGKLLAKTIPEWLTGKIEAKEQEHDKATFSKFFTKEDALIDLSKDDYQNYLKICAYDGWPGAYFFEDGKRIKITAAHMQGNKLAIDRVIPEGRKETNYQNAASS